MAEKLVVGQTWSGNMTKGVSIDFNVTLNSAKYTVKTGGVVSALVGVYKGDQVIGSNGVLRVCGNSAWGCHLVKSAGNYLVRVTPYNDGSFTLTVKPYNMFTDEFGLRFTHKSTC